VMGAFGSTGQRCTATSRLILVDKIADPFVRMLVERTKRLRVGYGLDEAIDMGPAVDENQMKKDLAAIAVGKQAGAQLLSCGERMSGKDYERGYFVAPTIFDHVQPKTALAQTEIFGPVLSVLRVKDFDEAMAVANDVPYGLTSSIYTTDANKIFRFT